MIIILNVSEKDLPETDFIEKLKRDYQHLKIDIMQISAQVEKEIDGLESEQEKKDFLNAIAIEEPAINILTRLCMKTLNLISFFTVGSDEVKQWTVRAGAAAPQAAGIIHSDLEKGFIRAEVFKYDDLIQFGSEDKLKDAGKFYLKGKDYIVEDGDIMSIRFSV